MLTDDDLITVAEAARDLDESIATVHRRIRRGDLIPAMRLPGPTGAYLLRRADVQAVKAA